MPCFHLQSERLLLRPPAPDDLPDIVPLIGNYDVAKNLSSAPHPYEEAHGREFLAKQAEGRAKGSDFVFAITRRADAEFLGIAGAHLKNHGFFEIGYWLGKPYWRQGYATEAARKVAGFLFRDLKAARLIAGWYHDNPASGHVLEKIGFLPHGAEQRDCLARGHAVYCHMMVLERGNFGRRPEAKE